MTVKYGKKYADNVKQIEKGKKYELDEAIDLVKKVSYSKFTPTIEVHIKTWANPKYNDQILRGTVVLPHGTGKDVTVAAYVGDDRVEEAKNAWADIVGNKDLLSQIEADNINFDVLVTTPDMVRDLSKVAKILWPKGVMPSPKAGTVSDDLSATINEIKKGRVEFKLDRTGNIHVRVGKGDFENSQLKENIETLLKEIQENRPSGVRGKFIQKVVVAPTIGPGVEVRY